MSDRQLYRKTSEICGITPNQLVTEVRLQVAGKLLRGDIVKLTQLAMEIGVGTPAYLSRMFCIDLVSDLWAMFYKISPSQKSKF